MKKKNLKKVASLMAVAMTASTVMAGCGSKDAETSTTTTDSASTTTEATTGDAAATTDAAAQPAEKTGSITVMTYDRGNMPSSEGDLNNNRWTEWIKENCPVKEVEFITVPKAEAPQTMSALFASGEAPDLLPNYESLLQFNQNGMCLEITEDMLAKMPNYSALLEKYPMMKKTATVGGKMVYFAKFSNILPNHTVVIRKDWLDNLGLELPTTPDELYNVIEAFTKNDPDQNGQNDTWGINLTTDAQRVLAHMYGFGNPAKYAFDENGDLVYVWDRIESWLEFTKKIVDNKLINPDFVTMKGDDDQADFLSGKIGIYVSGRFTNASRLNLFRNFKEAFPEGSLDTFALPTTEYGQYTAYANGGASNVGFINSDIDEDDLDAVLAYSDWLYSAGTSEYLLYGPDGVYNKINDEGTYAIVDSEKNATEFDWASDYHIMVNELLDGREEPISQHANDWYNVYLASEDPVLHEFGDLYYKMCEIANDPATPDPRKWLNDGLPELPSDLALISTTADKQVNEYLKAAMADSSITAAKAIEEAKKMWYDAGGQQVDDYYNEYYKTMGDSALLMDDFTNAKSMPEMTEAAKANSKLFN